MGLYLLQFYQSTQKRCAAIFYIITFFFSGSFVAAQAPTITSFSPSTVCQGDAITITGENFTGATNVKLGTLNATNVVVNSPTSITAYVANLSTSGSVTVTTSAGTATTQSTLTILQAPIPLLTDISTSDAQFTNCTGTNIYTLMVRNNSSNTTGINDYTIDWGDNAPVFNQRNWGAGAQVSHTYNSQGYFAIVFTIIPVNGNGCTKTVTYNFYNGKNPLASLTTTNSTTGLCAPANVEFQIGNWFNNSAGTTYQLDFGDGTSPVTLPHPLNTTNTVHFLSHNYTTSSCPSPDFKAILKAINGCFTTTYTLDQIIIRKKPTADFTVPAGTACLNSPICFTNTSKNGFSGNSCNTTTTYLWDFGDGTTSTQATPPCHTYSAGGPYTVTLTTSNASCGSDTKTKTIVVQPASPIPVVSANSITYCQGDPALPLTATGVEILWYTSATGGTGSPTPPTPSTTTARTITYYVSQTVANSCESPRVPITVTVNAKPAKPGAITPVQLCLNQPTSPLTATGSNLLWYTSSTGGTGSSTPPTPSTGSPGSTTYYVSQTVNGCEGPRAQIEVIVNELATAPGVVSPITYCQNQPANPLTATGANLLWYTTPTGGTGSSIAPTPSTTAVGTTNYYVSQITGCGEGPRALIAVTVNAGPSASISYVSANLCNVVSTTSTPNPPVTVTQTGTPGGTFSISPSTGLPIDATTGTISPSGATAGTYTIKYTIPAGRGCPGFSTTASVNINNTPIATLTYPTAVCTSVTAVNPQLTGSQGGSFTSSTGLTINPSTGTITPGTSIPGTYTVTYTIAPAAPCPGFMTNTNITITKAPSATIAYNHSIICNVTNTSSTPNPPITVTQTGTAGGTYSIVPVVGLPIDAATGTLTPSGATAGTYTIKYYVPAANGCSDYVTTTAVTINGWPSATIIYPSAICTSSPVTSVQLNGSGGGSFTSSAGLIIDPSTGAITPSSSAPGTYTITYTIAASAPCPGFTTTTNTTITHAPTAAIAYAVTNLCNVVTSQSTPNLPVPVTLTGTPGGSYSISPATGLPIDAVTGALYPSGSVPGTYTVSYTLPAGGGCASVVTTAKITVSGAPSASISYAGSPYCKGLGTPQAVSLSGTAAGVFSSSPGLSLNAVTGAINPSLSLPGIYTINYTIAPSICPGYTATASVEIVASPVLSFAQPVQSICSGGSAIYIPSSTVSNTVYSWSVLTPLPPNVAGVTSGTVSGSNPSISLSFTNTGSISQSITVQVIPSNPAQNPCAGTPFNLTLQINPRPPAPAPSDTVHFCMGAPSTALTANALAGNTVKWYDQNLVLLPATPIVSTAAPAQFTFYVSQLNSFGCESPKAKMVVVVHPTPKIISFNYTHPTSCGIPSGSIVLNIVDISDNAIPNLPLIVHYNRFQTAYAVAASTDASGKITVALTAGTYSGIYVEVHGCASQTLPDVFVLKDPTPPSQPISGSNSPICTNTDLNLTASSPTSSQTGAIQYVWAGPAFGPLGDTVTSTVVSFPSPITNYAGTYVVYAIQNNCISLASTFTVIIKQSPSKPIINTNTPLCVGSSLTLQAHSSIPASDPTLNYVWTGPGAGFPVHSSNAAISSVSVSDAGTYAVSVTSPLTGCSSVSDTLIQIGGYPIIKFPTDTITAPTGQILNLAPIVTNAADPNVLPIKQYEWSPMQDVVCIDPTCSLVKATVKNNVCFIVKATNIYGCSDTASICIRSFCQGSQVFIPNAFLPLGDIPENRKLIVRASGIATVKSFRVFNRWGKVVFEKNNFPPNSPDFGWDGKFNGKPADQGVYVYTVEVICENGTPYFFKGNVTLL
jgi:PKD repeat protein